ncbi:MAG: redoxin domain-containing protein [Boseongicola sp.]|nr:redoxin domain-containing protein [Boseongicola sp.]
MSSKPNVDAPFGPHSFPALTGGEITVGAPGQRWTLLIVYRGRHCPKCKAYLNKLQAMLSAWNAVMDVVVVSADTREKAEADAAEFGWSFPLCYGLTEPQMRALGLYVSDPLSEAETTTRFAEPGTFAIRPDGTLMLVDISNGPAARPDLDVLLGGMQFNIDNNRPTRGTA